MVYTLLCMLSSRMASDVLCCRWLSWSCQSSPSSWRWWCYYKCVCPPWRSSMPWMLQCLACSAIALGRTYGRTAVIRLMLAITPRIGRASFATSTKPLSIGCTRSHLQIYVLRLHRALVHLEAKWYGKCLFISCCVPGRHSFSTLSC